MFSHLRRLSTLRGWNLNPIGGSLNDTLKFSSVKNIATSQVTKPTPVTFCFTKPNHLTTPAATSHKRLMSYDSSNKTHQKINDLITKSKKNVFVFMKGGPSEPLCRYSGIVVQILDAYGVDYDSADVLESPDIRQEIKNYSDWPTIPQVYVDGSFVGGCDILLQMHQSGELKSLFKLENGKTPGKPDSKDS